MEKRMIFHIDDKRGWRKNLRLNHPNLSEKSIDVLVKSLGPATHFLYEVDENAYGEIHTEIMDVHTEEHLCKYQLERTIRETILPACIAYFKDENEILPMCVLSVKKYKRSKYNTNNRVA